VVTNRQTDRQTNAGDYIIPRESFRGDNYNSKEITQYNNINELYPDLVVTL